MNTNSLGGVRVAELAQLLGGTVFGDGERVVNSCNTLPKARPDQISFLHIPKYAKELETTQAGCVILGLGEAKSIRRAAGMSELTAIEVKTPRLGWQQAIVKLHGYRRHPAIGISDKAVIHPTAKIGKNVNIHPFVVIGEDCEVGDNSHLYPHVTMMARSKVGSDTIVYPSVTIYDDCTIGNRCILHAGASIGSDGYGFAQQNGVHNKIPHIGNVRVEDDVEIGSNGAVERAVMETTVIGAGTKIGNMVVIGHNCIIGRGNLLVSQVGLAGSCTTGAYVVMGGQAGINQHVNIPDMVKIGAQSGVVSDPSEPNIEMLGSPAMEGSRARRVYGTFMMLPELMQRIRDLEKQVKKLSPKEEAK
jgi:UDP-3-O-[3-hydroxymyristoyl] glucosamine N-acyltransferase